jgi:hypothetical protein
MISPLTREEKSDWRWILNPFYQQWYHGARKRLRGGNPLGGRYLDDYSEIGRHTPSKRQVKLTV